MFELPKVIEYFIACEFPDGWRPIYYNVGENGDLCEVDLDDLNRGVIVRIEVWVESQNQYVYTDRLRADVPWSVARFGEGDVDQKKVYGMRDISRGISSDAKIRDIHPLVRDWFRDLHC